MNLSIILAQYTGVIMLIFGTGLMLNASFYKKLIKNIEKEYFSILTFSIIGIVTGMYLVLNHNIWELNYKVLITIIGWGIVIKSALFAICPNQMFKITKKINISKILIRIIGAIYGIVGLFLISNGFGIY